MLGHIICSRISWSSLALRRHGSCQLRQKGTGHAGLSSGSSPWQLQLSTRSHNTPTIATLQTCLYWISSCPGRAPFRGQTLVYSLWLQRPYEGHFEGCQPETYPVSHMEMPDGDVTEPRQIEPESTLNTQISQELCLHINISKVALFCERPSWEQRSPRSSSSFPRFHKTSHLVTLCSTPASLRSPAATRTPTPPTPTPTPPQIHGPFPRRPCPWANYK